MRRSNPKSYSCRRVVFMGIYMEIEPLHHRPPTPWHTALAALNTHYNSYKLYHYVLYSVTWCLGMLSLHIYCAGRMFCMLEMTPLYSNFQYCPHRLYWKSWFFVWPSLGGQYYIVYSLGTIFCSMLPAGHSGFLPNRSVMAHPKPFLKNHKYHI